MNMNMKLNDNGLALIFGLLLAGPAAAGDAAVVFETTLQSVQGPNFANPVLAALQVGDHVTFQFEVTLASATPGMPGTLYTIDSFASFIEVSGGVRVIADPAVVGMLVLIDSPNLDALVCDMGLDGGPVASGFSSDPSGGLLMTEDLANLIGSTLPTPAGTPLPVLIEDGMTTARFDVTSIRVTAGGNDVIGITYCNPGVANSSGRPGTIAANGSRLAADNNVTLQASSLPLLAFGMFATSRVQSFVANPGGSLGNLCLGGAVGRFVGPGQIQNSGTSGSISLSLDLTQQPTPTGFVSITAGETWSFQLWYRDSVGGAPVSNFTDGLELTFI